MIFVINQLLLFIEMLLFGMKRKKLHQRIFLAISFCQLFVLLAFRSFKVGIDTPTYLMYFDIVASGGHITVLEPLNLLIMKFAALFSNGELVYLSLYAFLTLICYYRYIVAHSEDIYMSVFMLSGFMFYYFSFNAMRQGLALAICTVAISELLKDKQIRFFVLVLIAAGFHSSALIILPLWVVKKFHLKFSVKIALVFTGIGAFFLLFGYQIVRIFVRLLPKYQDYLGSVFGEDGNILNPIMYAVILMIVVYIWTHDKKEELDHFWLYMLGIGVVLYFASLQVGIVNRLVYYYTISVVIFLPNILRRIPKLKNRVPLTAGVYGVVFMYSFLLVQRGAHGIVPYTFFWQV